MAGMVRERLAQPDARAGSCSTAIRARRRRPRRSTRFTAARGPVSVRRDPGAARRNWSGACAARRVCEDCGANADAYVHPKDALPRPVPEHRPVPIDRPEVGGAVGRFGDGGAGAAEDLLARYAPDDRFLQRAADLPADRRSCRRPSKFGKRWLSAVASALGLPAAQLRSLVAKNAVGGRERVIVLPVGSGDRAAGARQRAGRAGAHGAAPPR